MTRTVVAALLSGAVAMSAITACGDDSYLDRRARFHTRLVTKGKRPSAFQTIPHLTLDDWRPWGSCIPDTAAARRNGTLDSVQYKSGDLELPAWVYTPAHASGERLRAIVYLHPGSALWAGAAACASPFMDAGMVVMWPMYRGENGSPGTYELVLGEVDDAVAASRWLAAQGAVDPAHVYLFGWSSGGVVATMVSLMETPLRHSGSSGGIDGPANFYRDFPKPPFDSTAPGETAMRVLPGNLRWMRHDHYAYIGDAEAFFVSSVAQVQEEMRGRETRLHLQMLPGDHFSSYNEAMHRYLRVILADTARR